MRILYSFPQTMCATGIGATAINKVLGPIEPRHDVTIGAKCIYRGSQETARQTNLEAKEN